MEQKKPWAMIRIGRPPRERYFNLYPGTYYPGLGTLIGFRQMQTKKGTPGYIIYTFEDQGEIYEIKVHELKRRLKTGMTATSQNDEGIDL